MPGPDEASVGGQVRGLRESMRAWLEPGMLILTIAALFSGAVAWLVGNSDLADGCWIAGTVASLVPAIGWVITALVRKRAGVDRIAVLALAGTLLVGEFVAGALIAVMLATGRAPDAAAERCRDAGAAPG
jgi:hypothetical protein